jgi:uracil-DNA glycosylase
MTTLSNRLEENWHHIVGGEFDYMAMEQFLQKEKEKVEGTIYPKDEEIFNALNLTPLENIRVVIIGQDPYPGEGQAHGLCFSTKGKDIPRSLKNIYEEIQRDCRIQMPPHGDLTKWAAQGVLLLNATLTVRKDEAGSHQGKGWGKFTDAVIRAVNKKPEPVVFLLWGRYAQKKRALINIDREKHLVLETWHPAARSTRHCFLGCGHFKKANDYLKKHGLKPIDWQKIQAWAVK